jgi:hypothetical protein
LGKNRGTPPSNLVSSTSFSLKSLGHSPARDFFLGVIKKSCVWVVIHRILPKELRPLPCQGKKIFWGLFLLKRSVFGYSDPQNRSGHIYIDIYLLYKYIIIIYIVQRWPPQEEEKVFIWPPFFL